MPQPSESEPGSAPALQAGASAGSSVPADHPSTPEAFFSYSRKDKEVVHGLHAELTVRGRDVWVDWEDIQPSEAFMQAIERAIEAASVFVFVLSPDSVRSTVCRQELEHAVAQGKKLVPVLCRDVASDAVPPVLAPINWIFARGTNDVASAVDALCQAFDTDLDWLRAHTRLVVRAVEWDRNKRNRSFLLNGIDLDQAERALTGTTAQRSPQPTVLQREYVLTSRRRASARLRALVTGVSGALVVAASLAFLAEMQRRQAVDARRRGLARQLAAQSELVRRPWGEPLTLSALLAAESLRQYPSLEGDLAMRRALALLPRPVVNVTRTDSANTRELSADGRLLAVSFDDGRIRLLDTFTGQRIAELKQTPVTSLAWSGDGRYLRTVDEKGVMRIWSVEQRDTIARFEISGELGPVAFSANGARVAFASTVGTEREGTHNIIIHNLAANREVGRFGVARPVSALALDSTGQRVVVLSSAFMSSAIEVREQPFQRVIANRSLDGHVEYPTVNASGTMLAFVNVVVHIGGGASGKQDVVVETIEPRFDSDGVRLESSRLAHPCDVTGINLSPDGDRVVTTCKDSTVHVWLPSGEQVAQFAGPGGALAVGPAARTIALSTDGMTHLFGGPSASHVATIPQGGDDLALTADGRYVVILDREEVAVWEGEAGEELIHLTTSANTHSVLFSPDDSTLAVCTESGVSLFPVRRNAPVVPLAGSGNALGCAWADSSRFFTVSASGVRGGADSIETIGDNDIRIWDGTSGREITRRPRSVWTDFALSENGQRIAIAERNDSIVITESASGRTVRVLAIPASETNPVPASDSPDERIRRVTSLQFSARGEQLAVIYKERHAQVWDLATGAPGALIDLGGPSFVSEVAPDGRRLVTTNIGSMTSSAHLWDARSGREITLAVAGTTSNEIAFSADGKRLASVTDERVVRVHDAVSLREISSFRMPERVLALRFSPDAQHIATGSDDHTARIWEAQTGRELARMSVGFSVFNLTFNHQGNRLAVSGLTPDVFVETWQPDGLLTEAGGRASRNLTLEEWQRYLPDDPCRPTFASRPDRCRASAIGQ